MSRIGKAPIDLSAGVEVKYDDNTVVVKGPKGSLSQVIDPRIGVSIDDGVVTVSRDSEDREVSWITRQTIGKNPLSVFN